MKTRSVLARLALCTSFAACAGGMETPAVGPNDIPALEAAVEAVPGDADRLTALGVAYYNAGRHADAVGVLDRAIATGDADEIAHLHLGLAHEALEQWQQASDAYAAFLADAGNSNLRRDVENRVALVERRLMEEQLRAMLAQEAALANQEPEPRTVAVFPFRVVSDDARYEPLQQALADMVTTDLGIPGSLQVLERAQIQALVQEMALTLAGFTEPASGARVGRLMRAEHVVQGSVVLLGSDRLRLEMAVVDPAQASREGEAADEAELERIFDAEKQLVVEVLTILGVTLTAAEREAIEENRTSSLLALLAYGEGLEAMDRGEFAAAAAAFQNATAIDPGFRAAQVRAQEASSLQEAAQTTGTEIAAAAQAEMSVTSDPTAVALVDQIIPDINRSGVDELSGTPDPGGDIENQETSEEVVAPRVTIPIVVDNPNRP